ncbi:MAG: nitroreductase [Campylobacterota bacterium]|nr:nitroreductase [Campylobacterota bacterium]
MKVSQALIARKSVRAYLKKEVEKEKIQFILEHARFCPSGVNMQPWQVCVVQGDKKIELENKLLVAFKNNQKELMDYDYYPLEWSEPYKSRRKETGLLMYETLKIKREDKQKQYDQWAMNYKAFEAPVVLYFFIDKSLAKGSYLDYGMFWQSIMLLACEVGLTTCPQASLAEFPKTIKKELSVPEDKILLGGIALGYEDKDALVNSYRTSRIKVEEFTTFYE